MAKSAAVDQTLKFEGKVFEKISKLVADVKDATKAAKKDPTVNVDEKKLALASYVNSNWAKILKANGIEEVVALPKVEKTSKPAKTTKANVVEEKKPAKTEKKPVAKKPAKAEKKPAAKKPASKASGRTKKK